MRVTRRLAVATGVLAAGFALGLPTAAYADGTSSGNAGIGNGTQVQAPVQAPVNVCGNGVGVAGAGIGGSGDCKAGASDTNTPPACPSSGPGTYHSDTSEAKTVRKPEATSSACPQTAVPTPSTNTPSTSPSTVQVAATKPAAPTLPVTGAKLTIIVTTALVLLAAGVSAIFLARRRRA
ncbi:MAG TPA: chaplin family protein [Actinocatenispora sp.]